MPCNVSKPMGCQAHLYGLHVGQSSTCCNWALLREKADAVPDIVLTAGMQAAAGSSVTFVSPDCQSTELLHRMLLQCTVTNSKQTPDNHWPPTCCALVFIALSSSTMSCVHMQPRIN